MTGAFAYEIEKRLPIADGPIRFFLPLKTDSGYHCDVSTT